MGYDVVRQCITFALDCLVIWTLCRILSLRSRRLFVLCSLASIVVSQLLVQLQVPNVLHTCFGMATFGFGLPLAFSEGAPRVRIARIALVNMITLTCGFAASGVHLLLTGSPFPEVGGTQGLQSILMAYAVVFLLGGLLLEILVAACDHARNKRDTAFELPVIIALLWSCVLCAILEYWLRPVSSYTVAVAGASFLSSMLAVALGLAAIPLAQRDARAQRILANRAASQRQVRHVRAQIESSTQRLQSMRRLRHDMTNQVDVVRELAESGLTVDADRYLVALQQQAHRVAHTA